MSNIILDFNGWLKAAPEDCEFTYIGEQERPIINGVIWQQLPKEERSNYLLCFESTYNKAIEGQFEQFDMSLEKDEDD